MEPFQIHHGFEGGKAGDPRTFVSKMALYDLEFARSVMDMLAGKETLANADTAPFDCMHYDGDAALDHAAYHLYINEKEHRHVLDIGSGFSASGRYLSSKYKARVVGIELQPQLHELANGITRRNEDAYVRRCVRSVNGDFQKVTPKDVFLKDNVHYEFDGAMSFLCIMHLPKEERVPFLEKALEYLKPKGRIYIEDFYHRKEVTAKERETLRDLLSCSYLPTIVEYFAQLEDAGFELDYIEFEDVTAQWRPLLTARAQRYKEKKDRNADLERFFDAVAELFEAGNVGGLRITAMKPDDPDRGPVEEVDWI